MCSGGQHEALREGGAGRRKHSTVIRTGLETSCVGLCSPQSRTAEVCVWMRVDVGGRVRVMGFAQGVGLGGYLFSSHQTSRWHGGESKRLLNAYRSLRTKKLDWSVK